MKDAPSNNFPLSSRLHSKQVNNLPMEEEEKQPDNQIYDIEDSSYSNSQSSRNIFIDRRNNNDRKNFGRDLDQSSSSQISFSDEKQIIQRG